uniref:Uncharacterized protein n=1 Tax=Davidia involucrata TaxID=16924 RepID=A0A5B7CBY4_DAVIN
MRMINHNLNEGDTVASVRPLGGVGENGIHEADRHLETQEGILEIGDSNSLWGMVDLEENNAESSLELRSSLRCPLCRGTVLGWKVVEKVRKYLNLKSRSCSHESCSFFSKSGSSNKWFILSAYPLKWKSSSGRVILNRRWS